MSAGALLAQQSLTRALGGFLRAYQMQSALVWGLRLLAFGLAIDVAALAAARFVPRFPVFPLVLLVLPPLLGVLVGATLGVMRRPHIAWLARQVDGRLGLHERTLTALDMAGLVDRGRAASGPSVHATASARHALVSEQLADAVAHLRRSDPTDAFPLRLPRREALAVLLLALALAPPLLLSPPTAGRAAPALDQLAAGEAERIAAVAEEIEREADPESAEQNAQVAAVLRDVAQALQDAASNPDRAVAQVGDAERRLSQLQSPAAFDAQAALSRLADALDQNQSTRQVANAIDRRDYSRAADELRQLGQRAASGSEAERQAIADAMRRGAAASARYDERLAEALRQAAEGAAQGQSDATENAAREMARTGREVRRQETLERAMSQLQNSRQAMANGGQQASGESRSGRQQSQGTSGAGDPGEGQDGEGQGQGRGQGQGGEGSGGQGQGQGDGQGQGEGRGSGAGTGTGGQRSAELYDPAATRARQVEVPGGDFDRPQVSDGDSQQEDGDGEVRVDYRDVLPTYQERATRAMQDRYIPLGMKDLVREYFSSLQPAGTGSRP